jgi:hypothetical protein
VFDIGFAELFLLCLIGLWSSAPNAFLKELIKELRHLKGTKELSHPHLM